MQLLLTLLSLGVGVCGLRLGIERAELCEEWRNGVGGRCRNAKVSRMFKRQNWTQAAEEEGIDPSKVSLFGRLAPKLPRSVINEYLQLNRSKVIRYSFMGSLHHAGGFWIPDLYLTPERSKRRDLYVKRRAWVNDFIKENFGNEDYLNICDVPPNWVPLGKFDHSFNSHPPPAMLFQKGKSLLHDGISHFADMEGAKKEWKWKDDTSYWKTMSQSKFTLCPGGDGTWSFRSFEAVLAGAVPVIRDPAEEWRVNNSHQLAGDVLQAILEKLHYVRTADLSSVQAATAEGLAKANWKTLIKYMTFMEGDNELPGFTPCSCNGGEYLVRLRT